MVQRNTGPSAPVTWVTTAQPLRGAYVSALGGEVPWLDDVMTHPDAKDAYWRGASSAESAKRPRVHIGGENAWRNLDGRPAAAVSPWFPGSALRGPADEPDRPPGSLPGAVFPVVEADHLRIARGTQAAERPRQPSEGAGRGLRASR
ncbi:hypothetical protein [Streptomyces sp. NPDC007264]|uniref:hypothetical protein n=1 Tax=Streptomyces sp. NPDC007264 TaxID=3364777 RepID=UPI0036DC8A3E